MNTYEDIGKAFSDFIDVRDRRNKHVAMVKFDKLLDKAKDKHYDDLMVNTTDKEVQVDVY